MKKLVLLTLLILVSSMCFAPKNPYKAILLHKAHEQYVQNEELEERISLILKTIRIVESGGSYTIGGASGETGAYQFTKPTWRYYCLLFFGKVLDIKNPTYQDIVARKKVTMLINKGYSNTEIASIWNCGSRYYRGKVGVNSRGVAYNVPRHVCKFMKVFNKLKYPNYIPINMRNRRTELVEYNDALDASFNTFEGQWTKKSIEKKSPEWWKAFNEVSKVASKCQITFTELSQALNTVSKKQPITKYQRFINYLKNMRHGRVV